MSRGGTVLGPVPDAQYERGYTSVSPGAVLLAFTDGITEAENASGEAFGVERLRDIVLRGPWTRARALVEAVFAEVVAYSGTATPEDDQTVLAVVRPVSSQ